MRNFQNFLTKPVIHDRRRMASGRCKDYDQSLVQLGEEWCRLAPDDIVALSGDSIGEGPATGAAHRGFGIREASRDSPLSMA